MKVVPFWVGATVAGFPVCGALHAAPRRVPSRAAWTRRGAGANVADLRLEALRQLDTARSKDDTQAYKEAVRLYGEVVRLEPQGWRGWADLSGVMLECGSGIVESLKVLQRAIVACEVDGGVDQELLAGLYYEFGSRLAQLDGDKRQVALVDEELIFEPVAPGEDILAYNALNALTAAVAISTDTIKPLARHARAALRTGMKDLKTKPPRRASKEYVETVFDVFAPTFDDQLARLNYSVPLAIATLLKRRVLEDRGSLGYARALDAGCGTGLAGVELRRARVLRGTLSGVDLSIQMCDRAAGRTLDGADDDRKVYDRIACVDMTDLDAFAALKKEAAGPNKPRTGGFDLIVAADSLVYFGDLNTVLASFDSVLALGGDVVVTCEDAEPDEGAWALRRTGRYAHSRAYVRAVAMKNNLFLRGTSAVVARMEDGKPVTETIYVLQKPRDRRR